MSYNNPKVSVIIPVYNTEKYLRECLDSVVNQSLRDIEIICINDGSTDASLSVLEAYREKDSRITVISQVNEGPSSARNTGMRKARGTYLSFVDSDDCLDRSALEKLFNTAQENGLDILLFENEVLYETEQFAQNPPVRYKHISEATGIMSGVQYMRAAKDQGTYTFTVWIALWRRAFLGEHGIVFKKGIIHEDNLFIFQAYMAAGRVMRIPDRFYTRRLREHSIMTSSKSAQNSIGYFSCAVSVLEYAMSNSDPKKEREILREYDRLLGSVRHIYKAISDEEREKISFSKEIENTLFHQLVKDRVCMEASCQSQKQRADALRRDLDNAKKEADALRRDLAKQKQRADALQHELDGVHDSVSFRVGRGITYLPRMLRDLSAADGKADSEK